MSPMVGPGAESSLFFCIRGYRSPRACFCSLFLADKYGGLPTEFHFSGNRVYRDLAINSWFSGYEIKHNEQDMLRRVPIGWSGARALIGLVCCLAASLITLPHLFASNVDSSEEAQNTPNDDESANLFEAVVRYQIESWEFAANSYCISIQGKDATNDFLRRLTPLPVKAASGCRKQTTEKVIVSVVDKKTGKRSVIFDVAAIHWISENEAAVEGGYFCANLCMASGLYHVVRDGTKWRGTRYDVKLQS